MKMSEALRKARELLGPNGENWIKYAEARVCDDSKTMQYCSIGAIHAVGFREDRKVNELWSHLIGGESFRPAVSPVVSLNDSEDTKFTHIEKIFQAAIDASEALEAAEMKLKVELNAEVEKEIEVASAASRAAQEAYNVAVMKGNAARRAAEDEIYAKKAKIVSRYKVVL